MRAMLSGMVSPIRPLFISSICAFGINLISSCRITEGYVAAELKTHKPTVEDEPIATTFSRPPDFSCVSVRRSLTPIEMFELAARQVSAGDRSSRAWAEVELDPIGSTIERAKTQDICRIDVDKRACRRHREFGAV